MHTFCKNQLAKRIYTKGKIFLILIYKLHAIHTDISNTYIKHIYIFSFLPFFREKVFKHLLGTRNK